jgi:hypothetical protein
MKMILTWMGGQGWMGRDGWLGRDRDKHGRREGGIGEE